jgi:GTP pyrophosphokinase
MSEPNKSKRLPNPLLEDRFLEAFRFALDKHRTQRRKGSDVPYIAHLMGVTAIVLEAGGNEDQAIAALLHDVVEDQGGAPVLEEIGRKFGARVRHIVDGCTDAYTEPKPEWDIRKRQYIARVAQEDEETRLVSAADKLYNARSILHDYRQIGDEIWRRFTKGKQGTLWYYDALIHTFKQAGSNPVVDELERVVGELKKLVNGQG